MTAAPAAAAVAVRSRLRRSAAVPAICAGLLAIAGCGSSTTTTAAPVTPRSGHVAVVISNFMFEPMSVTVRPGTVVTWTNHDTTPHDIQSSSHAWATSPLLAADSPVTSWSHTFASAGTYRYICGIHPYMKATVVVTSS